MSRSSERDTALRGILLAAVGVPALLLAPEGGAWLGVWGLRIVAVCAGIALLGAALVISARPVLGRVLATVAGLGVLTFLSWRWLSSPATTLIVLLIATWGVVLLWREEEGHLATKALLLPSRSKGGLRGALIVLVIAWLVWSIAGADSSLRTMFPVLGALAVSLSWVLKRHFEQLFLEKWRSALSIGAIALGGLSLAILRPSPFASVTLGVLVVAVTGAVLHRKESTSVDRGSWWEPLWAHPQRLFVGTFAILCALGAIVLSLPAASAGRALGGMDALFMSTSAVCVTGLITVDTPVALSSFGQFVVLVLIQVGGLGIMTFSTTVLWALGRRMSLRHEGAVASLISTRDRGRLFDTARQILTFTAISEFAGTVVLAAAFVAEGEPVGHAFWRGLFTSISAFCNAGFALQSDSLVSYQSSPLVLHTTGVLIILGGLSPLVVLAIPDLVLRAARPVPAQAKLALLTAVGLLVFGFLFMLGLEWQNSLAGLSFWDKVNNAWFQSVTLRTAGFNSVDLALIQPATYTLMLILMFIGGSPGGTAGGIKTTTLAILALSAVQSIRGREGLEIFGRLIPEKTRTRAAVVVMVAASTGLCGLIAIQLTQRLPGDVALFEVVSALGTVGLSLGGTAHLDVVGKFIIILCMFVGRVGGVSLLMFLSSHGFAPKMGRPVEEIDVG